ncbi:hypothetical protein CDL15_Pgr010306 [Punica granatum]|uniref:Uncharacterized protein n=1 Tax=Punica granatum TaxID=22663 RepID=A0A218W1L9_PUNGR|nr:hypothetical protein CDL15_Pgr010306 [Punica granatum]
MIMALSLLSFIDSPNIREVVGEAIYRYTSFINSPDIRAVVGEAIYRYTYDRYYSLRGNGVRSRWLEY